MILVSSSFAAIKTFSPQEQIKASEINGNFNHIKDIFSEKNTMIQFHQFEKGDVISKDVINGEFSKVRNFGIEVDPISSERIVSEEINQAFIQILNGTIAYDDVPAVNNSLVNVNEDSILNGSLNFVNNVGTAQGQLVSGASNGSILISGTNYTYTPALNYNGADSFTFKIFDGSNYSAEATVSISVLPVNDAPIANAQSTSTSEDTPLSITLTGSDIDNDPLTYVVVSSPVNGSVVVTNNIAVYTPNLNYFGSDSFTFRINDGSNVSNVATVSITVTPVNDAPIALAESVSVNEDSPKAFTIKGSDAENSFLTFTVVTQPTIGTLSGTAPNLTYTPPLNYSGSATFTFRVNDGVLNSLTSTITFNVLPVNDAPISSPQTLENANDSIEITLTGNDVDGDSLSFNLVTPPTNGTLSAIGKVVTYTPNSIYTGSDTFSYSVSDSVLSSSSSTITINNQNRWPVGKDGPLNVTASQPVSLNSGVIYDFSSITVAAGATLTISGSANVTVLGSKGPVVINGTILSSSTLIDAGAYSLTTPSGIVLSFQPTRVAGGSGGRGGSWKTVNKGWGEGGAQSSGRGGGGGSGANDGSAGRPGVQGASSHSDTTKTHGGSASGTTGGSGGGNNGANGPSGYQAGGGGGGYVGTHGLSVAIITRGNLSGTGTVDLRGQNGFNGGTGGVSGFAGGGGGGGGSGGSGGRLWLYSPNSGTINSLLSGGTGGAGGVGPYNGGAVAAQNGSAGGTGTAGSVILGSP